MILLDSNTIIYLSKKLIKIDDILEDNTIPLVSVVTYMEVLGYDFKDDSEKNFIKKLFSFLEIVYIDEEIAIKTIKILYFCGMKLLCDQVVPETVELM